MDIDDILASVDRHDVSTPESTALDHQLLTRFWVAERGVSELLPWPGPLMERTMERLRNQIEKIEDLASSDPTTTTNKNNANQTLNLTLSILQTDLSRTQYLLRSILRQRLSKLSKHSMHYLILLNPAQQPPTQPSQDEDRSTLVLLPDLSNISDPSPLSTPELGFLAAHQGLLVEHYRASFLGAFPPLLRRLDDNSGGVSMVQGPDAREVVFVRCLVEEVGVVVPPGDGVGVEVGGVVMRMGEVWVVRWEGVRGAFARGEVEVL
ncbi:hypothetical protein BDV25DRAFT_170683 [Aspergillus avenaceus]|uniref:DNA replication complex GINS protein SLD5 n=1 Tax=Aspergillus avenaceus TaxID=36643 RepID=A0A5N6TG02_ASPAV|nr:hypothetical protein BDV25DRAFT_170683 [Aspergillus avenaceus]